MVSKTTLGLSIAGTALVSLAVGGAIGYALTAGTQNCMGPMPEFTTFENYGFGHSTSSTTGWKLYGINRSTSELSEDVLKQICVLLGERGFVTGNTGFVPFQSPENSSALKPTDGVTTHLMDET